MTPADPLLRAWKDARQRVRDAEHELSTAYTLLDTAEKNLEAAIPLSTSPPVGGPYYRETNP